MIGVTERSHSDPNRPIEPKAPSGLDASRPARGYPSAAPDLVRATGGGRTALPALGEELGATGEVEIPKRGTRGTGAPRTWLLWAKLVNRALPICGCAPDRHRRLMAARREIRRLGSLLHKESTAIKSIRSERERYTSMGAGRCGWGRLYHRRLGDRRLAGAGIAGAPCTRPWSGLCAPYAARSSTGSGERGDVIDGEPAG
jgi:hypothetical protein